MDNMIEYLDKVYLYSSGMSLEMVEKSISTLKIHGVSPDDVVVIEVPEGVPEGSVMVTIWPHYLSVSRVKRVREGSIYAPQLFNIDL
ncbi:MAG: hypothetical protein M3530_07880 [Thermoproteota archaeon]|jgi:hypothetical protein|nr:hypothetical protein [Thermoproteota archaeon]